MGSRVYPDGRRKNPFAIPPIPTRFFRMNNNNAENDAYRRRTVEAYVDADERFGGSTALDDRVYYEGIRLKRVLAYLIDVLIVLVLAGLWWLIGLAVSFLTLFVFWPLVVAGAALLPLAYHTCYIGGERHATLGMRALGIRVAAWNGHDPSYLQAFIQTVLFYLSVSGPQILVLLVSFFNDRGRCLHDILCGTVVVNVVGHRLASGAPRAT